MGVTRNHMASAAQVRVLFLSNFSLSYYFFWFRFAPFSPPGCEGNATGESGDSMYLSPVVTVPGRVLPKLYAPLTLRAGLLEV